MIARTPQLVKSLFPRRIWVGPKRGNEIYLTFDDGPIPGITPWVLEQLKSYRAKATFFCIGDNISKYPEIFAQVISEGHAVGNHTFNHLNGWKTATAEYIDNTEKAQQVLVEHLPGTKNASTAKSPSNTLFRPPYGKIKCTQAKELVKRGYTIVMWDILSMDYDSKISPKDCYNNVAANARTGSIIIFHDSLKAERNLKFALPKVLDYYSSKGHTFEKLPQFT